MMNAIGKGSVGRVLFRYCVHRFSNSRNLKPSLDHALLDHPFPIYNSRNLKPSLDMGNSVGLAVSTTENLVRV